MASRFLSCGMHRANSSLPAPRALHRAISSDVAFSAGVQQVRCEMAAAFRWFSRLGMNEGVANHFSYMVDDNRFLVNGFGRHFSTIKASELVLVDMYDEGIIDRKSPDGRFPLLDPSAVCIHGAMHRIIGHRARCILHLHPHYATALSSLEDCRLPPIDQNTMRFFNRLTLDDGFDGMGLGGEAERLATALGKNTAMIMGNHGVVVIGDSVAKCVDEMYYLELAARNYITALQTGKALRVVHDDVAEKTAVLWEEIFENNSHALMSQIMTIFEKEEPEFRE
mmetsp:Transcript_43611/g.86528  ORF Transcript_43611/g.86528 Transcript_43611/m.86528 type:complete len:281 (-) Transcript_43611:196-1038(-)